MRHRSLISCALAAMCTLAALAAATPLAAQARGTILGRVVDEVTLRPLPGVHVGVQNTPIGALTNANGQYLINGVPVGTQTLIVSLIGYSDATATVTVTANQSVQANFSLAQTAIQLEEVVVTGTPGAVQRRTVSNTVTSLRVPEITSLTPVSTTTQLLEGRTPGLTVMTPSGQVGVASNFRIRGASSLSAGTHPVFYVDGVRIGSGALDGFGTSNNTSRETSALDNINPEDIESIEVIKGPAASTLYGADAAAGVIQIITKKGRAGTQQGVAYSARMDYGQSDWALPMKTNYTLCTAARIADPDRWPGCDGVAENTLLTGQPLKDDDVLRTGTIQRYSASAQGGGERFAFYLSGDREQEEGVFSNNSFERTSGRGNFSLLPHDDLSLQFSVQYSRTGSQQPLNDNASNGWLRNAYRGLPGADAPWAPGWRGLGPDQIMMYDSRIKYERFIFGVTADYKPADWFRHRLTLGMDAGDRQNTLFYPIDRTGRAPFGTSVANGYISHYEPTTRDYTVDYAGTLETGLPLSEDLTSAFSFGMQYIALNYRDRQIVGEGLVADPVRLVSNAATTRAYESQSEQRSLGFFVQEQVGWKNRLFVTAGLRMDDHSAFGANFSRIYYPKAGVSYVISDEPFFSLPTVSELRLRASWGQAGNAPAPFSADRTFEASTVALDDGTLASALAPDSYGNPDLRAERGDEYEVGFDLGLFEDAVGVEFSYYNTTTRDALISVPVAPSTGFNGNQLRNIGEIHNAGTELSVFGTPVAGSSFVWDVRVGFATNANKLVSLGGSRDFIPVGYRSSQRHQEGYPLAGYWAEVPLRNPDGSLQLTTGGRPVLDTAMVYVGPSAPTREASLTNTFTLFRDLQVYTYLDYKGGHYLFNMGGQTAVSDGNARIANDPDVAPDSEEWLLARYGGNMPYIEKADYVKLREVSLRYSLRPQWAGFFGAKAMSIALSGRNLALWSDYSGSDPEVNIGGASTFTRAEYMSVPMMRQFVATIDLRF